MSEPDVEAKLAEARSLFERGDFVRSASILSRLLDTAPDPAALDLVEAEILLQRGQLVDRAAATGAADLERFDQTLEMGSTKAAEPGPPVPVGEALRLVVIAVSTLLLFFSLYLVFLVGLPVAVTDNGDLGGRNTGISIVVIFGLVAVAATRSLTRSITRG